MTITHYKKAQYTRVQYGDNKEIIFDWRGVKETKAMKSIDKRLNKRGLVK